MVLKSVKENDKEPGSSVNVISITKKDIPDSEFKLPKGYKSVPMSTFWGGRRRIASAEQNINDFVRAGNC